MKKTLLNAAIALLIFGVSIKMNAQNVILPSATSSATQSVHIGANAGTSSSGINNSFIGYLSGNANTTGRENVAIGHSSLRFNTTGQHNVAIGVNSLNNNTTAEGNTAIGQNAGVYTTTGNANVFIGFNAGRDNTTGSYNTFFGNGAGGSVTTGIGNAFFGNASGNHLISGNYNLFLGKVDLPQATKTPILAGTDTNYTIILADGAGYQKLYIDENGNTGIGLTNNVIPQNKLEIKNGATPNSSGLRFTNLKSTFVPTVAAAKFLTVDTNGDVVLATPQGTTIADTSIYMNDGTLTGNRTVNTDNKSLIFNTVTDGKIYIGNSTTFPATSFNYKLYVDGGILTESVKVALKADWADYVFDKNYKLKPLTEVEAFIIKNNHLPNVPSAKEVKENGIDLGDMSRIQQEKIEELMLYIIEQNKKIEEQNKEMKVLKTRLDKLEKK